MFTESSVGPREQDQVHASRWRASHLQQHFRCPLLQPRGPSLRQAYLRQQGAGAALRDAAYEVRRLDAGG